MSGLARHCLARAVDSAFERFEADWLPRLNQGACTLFKYGEAASGAGLHSGVADEYVSGLGLKPIGFNWELLDACADAEKPRSAIGEITAAIANEISNPSKKWLGQAEAHKCARDLLKAFDPASLTVVSNRYDGLWNPISGASVEWGFVLFDTRHIALLLITGE